jgi:hypothetical protein
MAATRPQATAPRKAPDIGLSAAVARAEGGPGREGWVGTVRGALELPDMRRIEYAADRAWLRPVAWKYLELVMSQD